MKAHNVIAIIQNGCRKMFDKVSESKKDDEICYFDILEFAIVKLSNNQLTISYSGEVDKNYTVKYEYDIELGRGEVKLTDFFSEEFTQKHFGADNSESITVNAYTESGDFVKCNNCDTYMLLPLGADKCPQCNAVGCMSWGDDDLQEATYDDLINRKCNIKHQNELLPAQYLSDEVLEELAEHNNNDLSPFDKILQSTDKCESFAEVILKEIRSDEEQPHHIGANIIKAYSNGNCDALLIALCGWSMDGLLEKYKNNHKYYICPACQNESLKYTMIELDDINIEEGYSCSECEAEYLGLHNEDVITQNPKITE